MAETLDAFLQRGRVLVDEALDRWLPKPPTRPAVVAEAMRYSVFAGGKRLRPMLTLAAAEAVAAAELARDAKARGLSRAVDLALPAACAIEMIHTYSLIHDDLPAMDNDTLRRGRPTAHVVYGEGIAILAGDGLHAEAFTLLGETTDVDTADTLRRRLRVLQVIGVAAGAAGMVGGQTIDLQAAGQAPGHPITLDAESLRDMHARKTGALIYASAVSGAIMAGADEAQVAAVGRYAREIGVAFQIVDDVLDVEGSAALLGKSAGKDAAASKPTYPSLFGLERSRALASECVERAMAAIDTAGLLNGQLPAIAQWVVSRSS